MKQTIIAFCLIISLCTFAQDKYVSDSIKTNGTLTENIKTLQTENEKLKKELSTLTTNFNQLSTKVVDLQQQTRNTKKKIESNAQQLTKISKTVADANSEINKVNQSLTNDLGNKSLYGIIGIVVAVLLTFFLYWLLKKKQKTDKTDIIMQLSQTKFSIEESLVKEFDKQAELATTQLELIKQQKMNIQTTPNVETDHSLALKVASEINLIERNIKLMDAGTKGLKQLVRSVEKLKDNLVANGYEMPELLGKQYHEGMKVIVSSSIPDENLEKGSEVITKILIPQVNYNDKMIQTAQIEVSVGN